MRVVLFSPGSSVAIVHGNPAAHGPLPPASVRPAGNGSLITTVVAAEGPRFVTSMNYLVPAPAMTAGRPAFATATSACGVSVEVTTPRLSRGVGSSASLLRRRAELVSASGPV